MAQVDLKLATEQHREALRGIVLMLLSLAGLAERAARRALPVRAVVLWLLYRAEAVARREAVAIMDRHVGPKR